MKRLLLLLLLCETSWVAFGGGFCRIATRAEVYSNPLEVTVGNGCGDSVIHPAPVFAQINLVEEACGGGRDTVSIGYRTTNTVVINSQTSTLNHSERTFLPDGVACGENGCSYRSHLGFNTFHPDAVILSPEEIRYVRLNIEHSWIGDIYIGLTCPTGQTVALMNWSGNGSSSCNSTIPAGYRGWSSGSNTSTGTDFGVPVTGSSGNTCDSTTNAPGVGWNYCWSENSSEGISYAPGEGSLIYRSQHAHNGKIDSSNVTSLSNFYHPNQSFSNLVGCPLNGDWYIEVIDGWSGDNGYIFGWGLSLTSAHVMVEPCPVTGYTMTGPGVTQLNDSLYVVDWPLPTTGDTIAQYTFILTDSCGQQSDTTVFVTIHAPITVTQTINDCPAIWQGEVYTSDTTLVQHVTTAMGCDSIVTVHIQPPDDCIPLCDSIPVGGGNQIGTHIPFANLPNAIGGLSQTLYPASMLTALVGQNLGAIHYHVANGVLNNDGIWTVSLAETSSNILSAGFDTTAHLTQVYSGALSANASTGLYIPFDNAFPYNGGNLLIQIQQAEGSGSSNCHFLGTLLQNSSLQHFDFQEQPSEGNNGWQFANGSNAWVINSATSNGGNNSLYISSDGGTSNNYITSSTFSISYAYRPLSLNTAGSYTISFDWRAYGEGNYDYLRAWLAPASASLSPNVLPDGNTSTSSYTTSTPSGWIDLGGKMNLSSNWSTKTTTFTLPSAGQYQLVFMWANDVSVGTQPPAAVDNVRITNASSSLFFSFEGDDSPPLSSDTATHFLPNMTVMACENAPIRVALPYCENFDSYPSGEGNMPDHWLGYNTLPIDLNRYPFVSHGASVSPPQSLEMHIMGDNHCFAILPDFDIDSLSQLNIAFMLKNRPSYHGLLIIGVLPNVNNTNTFIPLDTINPPDDRFIPVRYSFSNYHGPARRVALLDRPTSSSIHHNLYIDNFMADTADILLYADTTITACESYTWIDGNTYTSDTVLTYQTICGTSSTTTIHINNPSFTIDSVTACDRVVWHGNTYLQGGNDIATYTTTNAAGCDSIVTLNLTIWNQTTSTIEETIVENQLPYTFNGRTFTDAIDRTIIVIPNAAGCDSTIAYTLHVQWNTGSRLDSNVCFNQLPVVWNDATFDTTVANTTVTRTVVIPSASGSDSTIVMRVHVRPIYNDTIPYSICDNESYTFEGSVYEGPDAGYHPHLLHTAGFGCDSLRVLALDVRATTAGDTLADECDRFVWYGRAYTASTDTPTHHSVNSAGCDSTTTLHLTIRYSSSSVIEETIVENQLPYTFNGQTFTDATDRTIIVIPNAAGCDSTIAYTLLVQWNTGSRLDSNVCFNQLPVVWNGATFDTTVANTTVTRTVIIPSASGSDSTIVMRLWVKPVYNDTIPYSICDNESYTFEGSVYEGSDAGYHPHLLHTAGFGCDSLRVLALDVRATTTGDTLADECDHFTWWNTNYTNSTNTPTHLSSNSVGCDSVTTLHLTIRYSTTSSISETIVENQLPYTFNGTTFTDSTDLSTIVIPNAVDCDSTISYTLHIQWNTGSRLDSNVCFNQLPVTWNGATFDTSVANTTVMRTMVIPSASGSDSTIIMRLHVRPIYNDTIPYSICDNETHTFEETVYSGADAGYHSHLLHTDTYGCDSLRTLNLEVRPTTAGDTLADECDHFTWWNTNYTNSTNTPTHLSTNSVGCDSTTTLHLTIRHSTTSTIEETIIENDLPYTFNGRVFTYDDFGGEEAEAYADETTDTIIIPNSVGCDSVIAYTLDVLWNTGSRLDSNVCFNQLPVSWNGATFDTSVANTTVMRTVVIPSASGSDSTIIMRLHVRPIYNDTIPYSICDNESYTFETTSYNGTNAGLHTHHLYTATYSCDSLRTLNLEVRPTTAGDTLADECDHFTWWNTNYTNSTNTPTHLSTNSVGCDSTTTLHLTIRYSTMGVEVDTVVENQLPYTYHDSTFADSISHTAVVFPNTVLCDSVVDYTLFVHWNVDTTLYDTVCNDALPLLWNGATFDTLVSQSSTMTRVVVLTAHTGADSTITMHLTVHPLYDHHTTVALCDNQQFTFGDSTFVPDVTLTHNLAGASQYIEHLDSLLSIHGCDSLSTLHLTSWSTFDHHHYDTLCTNQSYSWGTPLRLIFTPGDVTATLHGNDSTTQFSIADSHFPTDTVVTDNLSSVHSCDSLSSLHLHLNPSYHLHFRDTICNAEWNNGEWLSHSYPFMGEAYDSTGAFSVTLSSRSYSCDSLRTLHLKVYPSYEQHLYDTIYDGDTYRFEGLSFDTTGIYPVKLSATFACDSVRILHLQRNRRTYNDSLLCQNALPLTWNGVTFYDQPHSGGRLLQSDSVHLSGLDGIDSLVVMRVTSLDTSFFIDRLHACDSLKWQDNVNYTASTETPIVTFSNTAGCDSVVHLALTVDHTHWATDRQDACDSMRWINNQWYFRDTTGIIDTIRTVADCDSIVTLDLTIHYAVAVTAYDTMCSSDTYRWLGHTVHSSADQSTEAFTLNDTLLTIHGCDSAITLLLTKMASPNIDFNIDIGCMAKSYLITVDARAPFSPGADPQTMPYRVWSSEPYDPILDGQENLMTIEVSPHDTTEYMIFVDYHEVPLCPSIGSIKLRPVIKNYAQITVNPHELTYENLDYNAYDRTPEYPYALHADDANIWERTWYVNGIRQATTERHLEGHADADLDSIVIALEIYNGMCRDTVVDVIHIRRVAIFAPNVFTPLEDNNNLFIISTMGVTDGELFIYTREGLLVYHTTNIQAGWDGRQANGTVCTQGAYVWRLNYHAIDRPLHLRTETGTVLLLK